MMTLSARDIVAFYVCPAAGTIAANLMFSAPIQAVRERIPQGSLGSLNPTPWAFMTGNCIGWVAYGFLIDDYWAFLGNAPGLIMSIWLNINAAKLSYQEFARNKVRNSMPEFLQRSKHLQMSFKLNLSAASAANNHRDDDLRHGNLDSKADDVVQGVPMDNMLSLWEQAVDLAVLNEAPVLHENLVVCICAIWALVLALVTYITMLNSTRALIVGIVVNLNLCFFYGAPLTTIFNVVRSLDSSSIHRRTMFMNTLNGAFWFAYGFAKNDYVWALPNGIGVLLGVIQFVLCVMFPPKQILQKPDHVDDEDLRAKLKSSQRMSIVIQPRDKNSQPFVVDAEIEALEDGDCESRCSSDDVEASKEV